MITPLQVYGSKHSYFTGKLETYLRYKEIAYDFVALAPETGKVMRAGTGTFQLPSVQLADGRWMTDSTPMIAWLETQFPEPAIMPTDPATRFVSLLVEDFADEWLWRPAMHYRWSYPDDRYVLGNRLGREILGGRPLPQGGRRKFIQQRQLGIFVRGDGVDRVTRRHADQAYVRSLEVLQAIFEQRPFLLGERPSIADIGFMGPMFRHFAQDPTPAHLMAEEAPAVWEWVARSWNARAVRLGDRSLIDEVPDDWDPILRESAATHLEMLDANAQAHAAGADHHDCTVQGVTYRDVPTSAYRVWCLEQLRVRFDELDADAAVTVQSRLERTGAWEPLWRTGGLASGHDPDTTAPFCAGTRVYPSERPDPVGHLRRRYRRPS
ncbi:MAG: glutathione S-transferase family protein [Acidimicrobiia bacterium]|nr:glutathione S-transferase family protein [Acidimicrobiia bacterium]